MIINHAVRSVRQELLARLLEVTPASIGHYLTFGVMSAEIKPTYRAVRVAGPAITLKTPPMDSTVCHYVMEQVQPGDVIVIDRCGDKEHAAVGEMVALAAKTRGAAAIVTDGAVTDTEEIEAMGLPVFSRTVSALATRLLGIDGEINTTVNCGGVPVNPGDIVFCDDNGAVVIPPSALIGVLEKAEESEKREVVWRQKITEGVLLADLSGARGLVERQ